METAFHTTGTRREEGCSRSVQMEFAGWPEQCHGGRAWWEGKSGGGCPMFVTEKRNSPIHEIGQIVQ